MSTQQGSTLWGTIVCTIIAAGTLSRYHAAVQKVQMERVDQSVSVGGNRGYLIGKGSAANTPRSDTREIAELQVELPSKAARGTRAVPSQTPMMSEETPAAPASEPMMSMPSSVAGSSELYTVKRGDTLWSIAHKFYGKGSQWHRVYEANRDKLPEPGRLRPGMQLQIPHDAGDASAAPSGYEK